MTGGNQIAAAREAWAAWKAAEGDQLERVVLIGRVMQEASAAVMAETGAPQPLGLIYNRALGAWRDRHGFADMPSRWCADAALVATHEAEVRRYWAAACAARARGNPSAHPSTLRLNTIKARAEGLPQRREPPRLGAAGLVQALRRAFDGLSLADRMALAEELAAELERVVLAAGDTAPAESEGARRAASVGAVALCRPGRAGGAWR